MSVVIRHDSGAVPAPATIALCPFLPGREPAARRAVSGLAAAFVLLVAALAGCKTTPTGPEPIVTLNPTIVPNSFIQPLDLEPDALAMPSNDRDWEPNLSRLPTAEFDGRRVTLRNIRDTRYRTEEDCTPAWFDKTFDLDHLQSVDFIVVPFTGAEALAHTMLSFGLNDGSRLVVSAEVRNERGEEYGILNGMMRQYELMYVVGTEEDLIRLRTEVRKVDVYLYPTKTTPKQVQDLFVDVMRRANYLSQHPEFYHTLTNNCTTTIVRHVNDLAPGKIPNDARVLLPGYSDRLAYELDLLDTNTTFEQTKRRAHINYLAERYKDSPDFSDRIRQGTLAFRRESQPTVKR